jgi:urease beta subunit
VLHRPWGPGGADAPGMVSTPDHEVELTAGRERRRLTVRSQSRRPVRISSHFPFWRSNRRLAFDRDAARGFRLDVPAGSTIGWAPGETKDVGLVRYGGQEASHDDTA